MGPSAKGSATTGISPSPPTMVKETTCASEKPEPSRVSNRFGVS